MEKLETEKTEFSQEEEKWVKYYSSNHQILLVGDGDFSFSLSLANSFGSASNIVASSFDPYDDVIKMYKEAKSNLENLEKLGASLLHRVDATEMKLHTGLKKRKFDRIIFNFPHAGFYGKEDNPYVIMMHKKLVNGFFWNARSMLRPNGEIHVNHKTSAPFCDWDLKGMASQNSLVLTECVEFKREDYPGYNNKRGASSRCDQAFPLGECGTFKFRFFRTSAKRLRSSIRIRQPQRDFPVQMPLLQHQEIPNQMQLQHSTSHDFRYPQTNFSISNMNGNVRELLPLSTRIRTEYCIHLVKTFGRDDSETLDHGNARYKAGRTLNGDTYMLKELHGLNTLRPATLNWIFSCKEEVGRRAFKYVHQK